MIAIKIEPTNVVRQKRQATITEGSIYIVKNLLVRYSISTMATSTYHETLGEYWRGQVDFAERALELSTRQLKIQVHPDQLKLEYNMGKNVVSMANYRTSHRTTPDDFEPTAA